MSCLARFVNWEVTLMTMNKMIAKLRKKNQGQYGILGICIFLSVLLVSAFAFMYFSKTVQDFLPEGGDTRKIAWLMLCVTLVGCTIFTIYGSNLFFKYKSREFGVFLALGERKARLGRMLAQELSVVIAGASAAGMVLAFPVSFGIWKLFQCLVVNTEEMRYQFGPAGAVVGILYTLFLALCILTAGLRFIRRADIMDILNDQRKTEMKKEIRPWTGKAGLILLVLGLFLGMGIPRIFVYVFLWNPPAVWNVTYLLCAVGLYLIMLSAVGHSVKGRRPEKYYKNIISTNLMRFTAKQTTKNMCVITLLLMVTVVAGFYGALYYQSVSSGGDAAEYDYSLHSPAAENQLSLAEIGEMAQSYGVELENGEELTALNLVIRFKQRDMDDAGRYFDIESEKLTLFLSASDFARLSGEPLSLRPGEYRTIVQDDYKENIWYGPDCLMEIMHPVTGKTLKPVYGGTVVSANLAVVSDDPFCFILSDEDYGSFSAGTADEWKEDLVLFQMKDGKDSYLFAQALWDAYIERATELSDHYGLYDAWEEKLSKEAGEEYGYSGSIGLLEENSRPMGDWKYEPFSKLLLKMNTMQLVAIYVLLSVYISVISLTAVAIMGYVRSMTIAMDNRKMFDDLKKLGAGRGYIKRAVKVQLRRIFSYPAAVGSAIAAMFSVLMAFTNDGQITSFEVKILGMEAGIILAVGLFMYFMYRISLKKMYQIIL